MNSNKNRIPENVKTIHLVAVCGTGMGALACMLKDLGFEVTGSDQQVYPPMSHFLARKGITVSNGFNGKNISHRPDLVVVGNAVSRENPEVQMMKKMDLNFCSMPQAINGFIAAKKKSIVVTGTHGKTTTSAIVAWILSKAGYDPTFIIGGILKDFDSNYRLGNGAYMVIEGDEYDTAFFDKGSKFMHYTPSMAILTSVEFDHADIFRDLDHVRKAFDMFLTDIPRESTLFAFDADSNINGLVGNKSCRVERYGRQAGSDWQLGAISVEPPRTSFDVAYKKEACRRFRTRLMGEHNLLNALSAVAVAHTLQIPKRVIADALESFQGVKRRQEVRGVKNGITVMDDFAHHPTAVRETIRAIKPFCRQGRLIAVFEPRTHSSMRKVFQKVYPFAFDQSDIICIRQPPLLEKIPVEDRFSSEMLVDDLKQNGRTAFFFPDTDTIIDFLSETAKAGDIVLIMSNGGFDNIHERLLESL